MLNAVNGEFKLDRRLESDTVKLASWPLSEVLLMNDSQYPWVILVPRRVGATEIYQLTGEEQVQLLNESAFLGETLMTACMGEKLNVAALGNVVSQLHLHHVVRFSSDIAWPGPVWGKHPVVPYTDGALTAQIGLLRSLADKCWD
jgi:diadenosine tetraphosphate (Ap4A) HIT family hydrolase